MNEPIWSAHLTNEMVAHLTPEEIEQLTEELSDAVAEICQQFETN